MDSQTKTTFATETLSALVRANFGTATRIDRLTPLTAGWFNTAYAITFANLKPDVVLRIAPHPEQRVLTYERDLMRREVAIIETVQGVPDIPAPNLVACDFSRRVIDRDCMFLARLTGAPFNEVKDAMDPAAVQAVERDVGWCVARLGEITGPSFGYFGDGPGAGTTTWRAAFLAMVEALLRDGEALDAHLPRSWDDLRTLFERYAPALDVISQPSLVHWDLWAGNVFVKPQNGAYAVEGIIDWERALWGDPDMETAVACGFYGPAFYEGYGQARVDDAPEAASPVAVRQSLYRLYLWLIMEIEAKVRFEDADHLPWVHEQLRKELAWLEGR